jgi:hypothetical protein
MGGEAGIPAFLFSETDENFEVLLAGDYIFDIFFFDKETLVSRCGKWQIIHADLGLP